MSLTLFNRNNRYTPCPKCRRNGGDSSGDNLVMWPDGSGHCFSCGFHLFPKYYVPRVKENNVPKSLRPIDFTREVPAECLKWLLQFGLPWSYWKETIGYSATEKRLVFEVSYDGHLAFSIGRYFGDEDRRKWYVWGDSHKHCHVMRSASARDNRAIVLVEDLISAAKVSQVTTAIPLFGTKIHPCHMYYLINSKLPVVLWLDKDQENNVKSQALRLESLLNRSVCSITTVKDPKYLSTEEINNAI